MKIFVLTDIPSPYQIEFLNQIAREKDITLRVGYCRRTDPLRRWTPVPISHDHVYLDDDSARLSDAQVFASQADLAVFNYYQNPKAAQLLRKRAAAKRPWCFWGERPGLRKPEWTGQLFRRWKLRELHSSEAPVWGIGKFALQRYRFEFGSHRNYLNLPYFSDLSRFGASDGSTGNSELVFLFSGSLIHRKGVDLVAKAFVRLLAQGHKARLKIIGDGELRIALERLLHPVSPAVEFKGFVNWTELPSHYAGSHVLCVPSRYDGWGLVVPEGLAAGLPVIATERMGAALEFLQSGKNGWLVPADSEDALFSAMHEAVSLSRSAILKLAQDAKESVTDHTLEHGAERFKQYSVEAIAGWNA